VDDLVALQQLAVDIARGESSVLSDRVLLDHFRKPLDVVPPEQQLRAVVFGRLDAQPTAVPMEREAFDREVFRP